MRLVDREAWRRRERALRAFDERKERAAARDRALAVRVAPEAIDLWLASLRSEGRRPEFDEEKIAGIARMRRSLRSLGGAG